MSEKKELTPSFVRLLDKWGVSCPTRQEPPCTVTVTKRDGTTKRVEITKLVMEYKGFFIYEQKVYGPIPYVGGRRKACGVSSDSGDYYDPDDGPSFEDTQAMGFGW